MYMYVCTYMYMHTNVYTYMCISVHVLFMHCVKLCGLRGPWFQTFVCIVPVPGLACKPPGTYIATGSGAVSDMLKPRVEL